MGASAAHHVLRCGEHCLFVLGLVVDLSETQTELLERLARQINPNSGFRYGDFSSIAAAQEWKSLAYDALIGFEAQAGRLAKLEKECDALKLALVSADLTARNQDNAIDLLNATLAGKHQALKSAQAERDALLADKISLLSDLESARSIAVSNATVIGELNHEIDTLLEAQAFKPTHKHCEGGAYQRLSDVEFKPRAGAGFWPGVLYKTYNGNLYVRPDDDWADRFTPIQPGTKQ